MVWKWPFLLVHKQPTNVCMKLPTIPLGLAAKIVKNRPLSEPIRLQDLEDKFMNEFICLISLMEHYLLCTGKDFSTKLTCDLQRLVLIHVSKSRQESTCIYCSDNVKSVGSDDSRQQTNTPCAAKYCMWVLQRYSPSSRPLPVIIFKTHKFFSLFKCFLVSVVGWKMWGWQGKATAKLQGTHRNWSCCPVVDHWHCCILDCLLTIMPPPHQDFVNDESAHLLTGSSSLACVLLK